MRIIWTTYNFYSSRQFDDRQAFTYAVMIGSSSLRGQVLHEHDMKPPHTPGAYNLKGYLTSWVGAGWMSTTISTTEPWEPTRIPYPEQL
ncbi:hypothetical protein AVEN_256084-1 [Araneus ventricosus]|uniref:Uncharacterized protein n=1 Tax=Araneus ventricosus TaxID=182803 RepID=A0A4Y2D5K2_ARAVE|nr:hypothetical protein AVEN_256084-1 [Araneus ventricosus]